MSTKAEMFHSTEERSGPKKAPKTRKPAREGRTAESRRVLESSRTRGQDIRVSRPHRPAV